MGIEAVKIKAKEVSTILMENGHHTVNQLLLGYLESLEESQKLKSSLENIGDLCHIKALGDLNIKTISHSEWTKHVEKLYQKVNQTLKQLKDVGI
jgi:hypothetical protein